MPSAKDDLDRFRRAYERRMLWDGLLRDGYRYAGPELDSGFQGYSSPGVERGGGIYDDTARIAAEDYARFLHVNLFPPQSRFFKAAVAPAAQALNRSYDNAQIQTGLDAVTDEFFRQLNASYFHANVEAFLQQTTISLGAMVFNPAPRGLPTMFDIQVVPLAEVYPERSIDPRRRTSYRMRMFPCGLIAQAWPDADIPDELTKLIKKNPADEVKIVEGYVYQHDKRNFRYFVLWASDDPVHLLENEQRTSGLILAGGYRAPGEEFARGAVLACLNDIRTLNKGVELILKGASIDIAGIWMADDDGVLDIDKVKLVPGTVLPIAKDSRGLQRLESGANFRIGELQMERLRRQVRYTIMRREPQALDKSHVTEEAILREAREVEALRSGGVFNLWFEFVSQFFPRGVDILARCGAAPDILASIDEGIELQAAAPWLRLQMLNDFAIERQAYFMVAETGPETIDKAIDKVGWQASGLLRAGFPADRILTDDELQANAEQERSQQAALMAAQAAGQAAPMVKELRASQQSEVV